MTPAPVYPSACAAFPLPDWVAAWMLVIACGFSWTAPLAGHAPGSGVMPCAALAGLAGLVSGPAATGMGRSLMTLATAGLAASCFASPGETVAVMALTSENS